MKINSFVLLLLPLTACFSPQLRVPVKTGLDILVEQNFAPLKGKRVGLVTHPPSVDRHLVWDVDLFRASDSFELVALFGPEHGLFGQAHAGEKVSDQDWNGIRLHSLYGQTRKPTPEMLAGLDILVFDLQDIGVRSYTYISTLALVMTACAEVGLPLMVLDRPNPIGGLVIDGPILKPEFQSFVGYVNVPYVHGLTMGEMARWINGEMLEGKVDLTVIPMHGWHRKMTWPETGLPWVPTSPHIPHWQSAAFCATTGIIGDLGWVNIGVGYPQPFELIGSPNLDGFELAKRLNALQLPGLHFRPIQYRPFYALFNGQDCQGVQIHVTDPQTIQPLVTCLSMMCLLRDMDAANNPVPTFSDEKKAAIDRLWGTEQVMDGFRSGQTAEKIAAQWQPEWAQYRNTRLVYLLYSE
ncbi:MAG: DUF1343 domain-containing protein [Acidobacteria bacterium]|nr:DUF1343 domain-containing protein [Acidobacteriota bacterium]MCB9398054.1 DUF1343 domain-containing protein [Acidobacteriota bacterium]